MLSGALLDFFAASFLIMFNRVHSNLLVHCHILLLRWHVPTALRQLRVRLPLRVPMRSLQRR